MQQRLAQLLGAVVFTSTVATLTFSPTSSASPALPEKKLKGDNVILAQSKVTDPAARQIVRSVANESLKSISTKDSTSARNDADPAHVGDQAISLGQDAGPIVLPAKIESHDAPGTGPAREPAAKTEPSTHDEPAGKAAAPAKPDHAKVEGVTADKALVWLENGNKRFVKNSNRTDGKAQSDRARLAKGQKPHAIVLSCSDSRVPPETVFDQSLGEVFVVRTAGESLDASVIASIEYAVEHLGPQLLVVMGHTSCGAVSATISTNEGSSAGSPALDALIADIRPRLPSRGPAGVSSQGLEIESAANAQGVASDLMKRSAIIRTHVEKGTLTIKPALYHLDSGVVKFY